MILYLKKKFRRGILIIQSDFQRYFVWDNKKASKLIESALLDIPLPAIYLSEERDLNNSLKEYVIDGQQRLTSFFSYIDGKFPDGRIFRLTGLEVLKELNGELFSKLDSEKQDKIQYAAISTITFKKGTDSNLKFDIFERLNTGSVQLNDQELRNCIYRGTYNRFLKSLALDNDFLELLNIKDIGKRMKDVEFVLRFAAFFHATYLNYKSPMKHFLNNDMDKYRNINESDSIILKSAFKNSVQIIKSVFGKYAFRRFILGNEKNKDGKWEPIKFNAALYDVTMGVFAKIDKNLVYKNLDLIREGFINLMTNDEEFINSINLNTSSSKIIEIRFDKVRKMLEDIFKNQSKQPRCFSYELKDQLFKQNQKCNICEQRIHTIDDASLDHIEQYWTGGQTIPENARLTHRYCNFARSKKDLFYEDISDKRPFIKTRVHIKKDTKTPQSEFHLPILSVLEKFNGSMKSSQCINEIGRAYGNQLTEEDWGYVRDGREVRWHNTVCWARNDLKTMGLLESDSPHGIWEISGKGRQYLKEKSK